MAIITRMIKLWKADVHGMMDQLEDKQLMLSQHLREMESALSKDKRRLNNLIFERDKLREKLEACESELIELQKDLDTSIVKEKDDIARFIIKKMLPRKKGRENMKRSLTKMEKDIESLRGGIEKRRHQYDALELKAKEYMRQAESNIYSGDSSDLGSDLFEDTVHDEEIELELLRNKERAFKGGAK